MEDDVLPQPTLTTDAEYEAAINQCLAEMERLRARMNRDQADIDRRKPETRAILAGLKVGSSR